MPVPKVYIDLCCLKRPFDARSDERIALEAEASTTLIEFVEKGKVHLIVSGALIAENNRNPRKDRREATQRILEMHHEISSLTQAVEARARQIHQHGLTGVDALHLALAESAGADAFVTCDEGILRFARRQSLAIGVKIVRPTEFLEGGLK
ncbi:MAG: PIN domain-containing protein [Nitrospirae bacterium]|nr:PIN domain-containing protein [Nitrospirota bacterium]